MVVCTECTVYISSLISILWVELNFEYLNTHNLYFIPPVAVETTGVFGQRHTLSFSSSVAASRSSLESLCPSAVCSQWLCGGAIADSAYFMILIMGN